MSENMKFICLAQIKNAVLQRFDVVMETQIPADIGQVPLPDDAEALLINEFGGTMELAVLTAKTAAKPVNNINTVPIDLTRPDEVVEEHIVNTTPKRPSSSHHGGARKRFRRNGRENGFQDSPSGHCSAEDVDEPGGSADEEEDEVDEEDEEDEEDTDGSDMGMDDGLEVSRRRR